MEGMMKGSKDKGCKDQKLTAAEVKAEKEGFGVLTLADREFAKVKKGK
jgi:hypothetical protein